MRVVAEFGCYRFFRGRWARMKASEPLAANTESPVFPELRGLIEKTVGIIPELTAAIEELGGRIELALLYGSMARGEEHAGSDIDLSEDGTVIGPLSDR